MDNQRFILWVTLGFLLWLSYQAWQQDYAPQSAEPARQTDVAVPASGLPDSLPEITTETTGGSIEPSSTQPSAIESLGQPQPPQPAQADDAPVVHVSTDVFDLEIGLQGGDIRDAILKAYPQAKDRPDEKVSLLSASPADLYQLQTGLRTTQGASAPDYRAWFRTGQPAYRLADGTDELLVELHWNDGQGISAVKRYTFQRGEYGIQVETTVTNGSDASWTGADYLRIRRNNRKPERSMLDVETFSFKGPVFYDGEKYEKLDSDEIQDGEIDGSYRNAWVASIQHHFLTAAVPLAETEYAYRGSVRQNIDEMLALGPGHVIQPGHSHTFEGSLFVGPKLTDQLEELAGGLRLTVDYGWLTIISQPLFWLLNKVHGFIGNWGWAILVVTVLLKLLFFKLTETSGKSMAKMRKLQPRIKLLQERYKDDREALSKSMMEMYKREKVNPVAGCLPMLVQMPVFLAFYWVLLESVEMRQAPFMLWITDLSSRDPYFILPVLMGAAMFGQFKLNPAPPDPVQAKVFMFMPLMMTGMMAFFPSGLVLYWFSNTLLSIAQQWRINKVIEASG
ncbi:MAG: membrane protein insertase YidC [Proteobacteria bacterium]|nr:membrane protein insertase YidC [Pseudomonadota bacterium]